MGGQKDSKNPYDIDPQAYPKHPQAGKQDFEGFLEAMTAIEQKSPNLFDKTYVFTLVSPFSKLDPKALSDTLREY